MPDVTPVRRKRRWRRVLGGVIFLLGVVFVLLWAFIPKIATWWIDPRLPWTQTFAAGSLSIKRVATQVVVTERPDVQVKLSPEGARGLAAKATNRWIPPWMLRADQQVVGQLQIPILRPQPFIWEIIAGGSSPIPQADVVVNHAELSEFLRLYGQTVITYGEQPIMTCTYVVQAGRITDVTTENDPPQTKRLWVEAKGSIILQAGQARREVIVRRLAGPALVTFPPVEGGYRMAIVVKIEESDADEITVPLLGDVRPMLLKQLETAANDGLIDGLEKVWLPHWVPLDTRITVVIE